MRSKYIINEYTAHRTKETAYQIMRVDRTYGGQFIREVILRQYPPYTPKDTVQKELRDGTFWNVPTSN